MCRYAFHNYRDHFACFHCRKAFKHWKRQADSRRNVEPHPVRRQVVCPDCARPMADMGLDFRAPSREDQEAWRILEVLYENGFSFHGCGCGTGLIPPQTLRELPGWLAGHRRRSEGEALLEKIQAR